LVALKIFFRFLAGNARLTAIRLKRSRCGESRFYLPETLNELQVEHLIENIDTKVSLGLRDRRWSSCFTQAGCAFPSWANARLENFNFEERILRVLGKGNKTRLVRSAGKLRALAAYLSVEAAQASETP